MLLKVVLTVDLQTWLRKSWRRPFLTNSYASSFLSKWLRNNPFRAKVSNSFRLKKKNGVALALIANEVGCCIEATSSLLPTSDLLFSLLITSVLGELLQDLLGSFESFLVLLVLIAFL